MTHPIYPEGEIVRVGDYPLTLVRRQGSLLHTFVLEEDTEGRARLRMGTQPTHTTADRLSLSQSMPLGVEQLGELAAAALAMQAQLTAAALVPPYGQHPNDNRT